MRSTGNWPFGPRRIQRSRRNRPANRHSPRTRPCSRILDLVRGIRHAFPSDVGGVGDVVVRGIVNDGGSHLAGNATTPGFLMCNACEMIGLRRLPSATDVLVIAENESITDVRLSRVERISTGLWSDTNGWIGALHTEQHSGCLHQTWRECLGGRRVQANNVLVAPGNGIAIQTGQGLLGTELFLLPAAP